MSGHDVGLLTAGVGGGICFAQAWHYQQRRRIEQVWRKAVRRAAKLPAAGMSFEYGDYTDMPTDPRAGEAPATPETVAVEPASNSREEPAPPARGRSPFDAGEETYVPARERNRTEPCSFPGCTQHKVAAS